MGEALATPTALQMTDISPNRWGNNEPPERNDDQDGDLKEGRGQWHPQI
ncbi:MAG: hypothetical protein RQ885_05495 [Desulfurococcales archaeon]|nr:hypothetical protein [Desulfurococcales archaeon]